MQDQTTNNPVTWQDVAPADDNHFRVLVLVLHNQRAVPCHLIRGHKVAVKEVTKWQAVIWEYSHMSQQFQYCFDCELFVFHVLRTVSSCTRGGGGTSGGRSAQPCDDYI